MNNLMALMVKQRTRLGLSQGQAAEKAGLSRTQWSRIETGQSGCPPRTVYSILRALGVADAAPAEEAELGDLSFDGWTKCPMHPSREIPIRGAAAYCARCAAWYPITDPTTANLN